MGTADLAFDAVPPVLPAPVARKQYVNALRVDLTDQAVSFRTTPAGGKYQTVGDTVTGFLGAETAVTVAINANFSWYDQDVAGGNFALLGLAVSQGEVVCDPTVPAPQPDPTQAADVPDDTYAGAMAMLITDGGSVTFQLVTRADPGPPPGVVTAIAGGPQPGAGWPPQKHVAGPALLVEDGVNQATPQACPTESIAGRTAVGVSGDGRYLYPVL